MTPALLDHPGSTTLHPPEPGGGTARRRALSARRGRQVSSSAWLRLRQTITAVVFAGATSVGVIVGLDAVDISPVAAPPTAVVQSVDLTVQEPAVGLAPVPQTPDVVPGQRDPRSGFGDPSTGQGGRGDRGPGRSR